MSKDVFIIGAGFSANLGFPLTVELLHYVINQLNRSDRAALNKVIAFHFPSYDINKYESYPNIEDLLTKIEINRAMFNASRDIEGKFELKQLNRIHMVLLDTITKKFFEIQEHIGEPYWLKIFIEYIKKKKATIITFNWDLVLDVGISNENGEIETSVYKEKTNKLLLLKPHGSLNWYLGKQGEKLKDTKSQKIWTSNENEQDIFEDVHLFQLPRLPISMRNRKYSPWILPPTLIKSFDHPFLQDTWRLCVKKLSEAKSVYFLGYSMPTYDFHSEFIFRCGFHNQRKGYIIDKRKRSHPVGPAKIIVVNPNASVKERITSVLGNECDYYPMTVASWVGSGCLN